MIPTLKAAREAVALILDPVGGPVVAVYDHETDRETSGPCWVTVDVDSVTPTDIGLAVRVYVQMADGGAELATDMRDEAVEAVDALLDAQSLFGPSQWTFGVTEDLQCLVARSVLTRGREDF